MILVGQKNIISLSLKLPKLGLMRRSAKLKRRGKWRLHNIHSVLHFLIRDSIINTVLKTPLVRCFSSFQDLQFLSRASAYLDSSHISHCNEQRRSAYEKYLARPFKTS